MKYRTINDLETICIDDMNLTEIVLQDGVFKLTLQGGIVKANNPENKRFEDVFCAPVEILFKESKVLAFNRQGFKYYDADGKLLNEVPTVSLNHEEICDAVKSAAQGIVFRLECCDRQKNMYRLTYDVETDCGIQTYEIEFTFSSSTAGWDRFCGPVEG